jgi:hypothetical protein
VTDQTPDPLDGKRREYQLEVNYRRELARLDRERADLEALDVPADAAMTVRQQFALATMLVRSGLVPREYRGGAKPEDVLTPEQEQQAAASVVLAMSMGEAMGLRGPAVFNHLQVVEGRVGLKPDSARGRLIEAGWKIEDTEHRNRNRYPVAHTTVLTEPDGTRHEYTYYLEYAQRGGMVDSIEYDQAGEVTGCKARSKWGKVLPWEAHPHAMLRHGADRELIRRYAQHVTGGMVPMVAGLPDEMDEAEPTRVSSERMPAPSEPPAAEYHPVGDLELIEQRTGSRDWRKHAGATRAGVRRRNPVQMAADRIAEWAARYPEDAAVLFGDPVATQPDPPPDAVEAEVVEDYGPPPTGAGEGFPGAAPGDPRLDDAVREQHQDAQASELAAAWSYVYDLLGDSEETRLAVFSYIRTELPDSAGLTGWQDLRPDHVRMYLRAMEPDLDDVADADD